MRQQRKVEVSVKEETPLIPKFLSREAGKRLI